MRAIPISVMVAAALFGCQDLGNTPPVSPIVEIVTSDAVPHLFSREMYGKFGFGGETTNILDQLQGAGFSLQDAWEPSGDGLCMMPETTILVIRLRKPDNRIIEAFGFSSDSEISRLTCSRTWRHYKY